MTNVPLINHNPIPFPPPLLHGNPNLAIVDGCPRVIAGRFTAARVAP